MELKVKNWDNAEVGALDVSEAVFGADVRPDILHRARRQAFHGRGYDDLLTRLRLKQAYGRLVRRADDRGVFVMLDAALPSRLLTAFPEGVAVQRLGLAEAVALTRGFLEGAEPGAP